MAPSSLINCETWLKPGKSRRLDLGKLSGLDTTGALFLCDLRDRKVELTNASDEHSQFLELIGGLERKPLPTVKKMPRWREMIVELGKGVDAVGHEAYDVIVFIARALNALLRALLHPSLLRPAAISKQISEIGIKALPIVGVMASMISVVIGYPGLVQLRPYGGDDFMINIPGFARISKSNLILGIRAEDLTLTEPSAAVIQAPVFTVELTGEATLVSLKLGHQFITAKADKSHRATMGERAGFSVAADRCYLFDGETELRLRMD